MNSTTHAKQSLRAIAIGLGLGLAVLAAPAQTTSSQQETPTMDRSTPSDETLSALQQAIIPIAAFGAAGDMPKLRAALNHGLDAGMTISDAREILIQLYAYAGFPRSLNALSQLMSVVDERKQRGVQDAPGRVPSKPVPTGDALLAAGTVNQTKLLGAPANSPLYGFAPTIDAYLKAHLFGDIFERDNLDWQSRELATVSMLSALTGVDSQLQSHLRISANVGLSSTQLRQIADVLADRVDADSAGRVREALSRNLASRQAG